MSWLICPKADCGERFALDDETEAFARKHEGLKLVCPFGHALWPFPAAAKAEEAQEPDKPKATRNKRVLPVTEEESVALERPTETASVHTAEPKQDMSASAEPASGDSPHQADSSQPDTSTPTSDGERGVRVGDTFTDEKGKHQVTAVASGMIQASIPLELATAAEVHEEPEAPAESASADGTEEEPITSGGGEPTSDGKLPPELDAYIDALEKAQSFQDVKIAMRDFFGTDLFKTYDVGEQNRIRRNTWYDIEEAREKGRIKDLPDHAQDVTAFRLWVEACNDPDAIKGTLAVLERTPAFQQKDPTFKDGVRKAAQAAIETILA